MIPGKGSFLNFHFPVQYRSWEQTAGKNSEYEVYIHSMEDELRTKVCSSP